MKTLSRCLGALLILVVGLSTAYAAPDHQQPGQLVPDQPQSGELSDAAPEEVWAFEGSVDDVIVIDMRAGDQGDLDPYLTLLDPDGLEIGYDDDSGADLDSRIGPYSLTATGTFTVKAGKIGGTGAYTIQLTKMGELSVIDIDQPGTGVLSAEHPSDFFLLPSVTEEKMVRLLAPFDSDHVPPIFEVYGPNGLITSSEYLENPVIDPLMLVPGISYSVVATWDGSTASAPYELRLEASRIEMLEPGVTQTVLLNDTNLFQSTHYFQGAAGERVRISLATDSQMSLSFDISSLDGTTYPFNSSGSATRAITVELELPASGAYRLAVYDGAYSYVEGSYTITFESVAGRSLDK